MSVTPLFDDHLSRLMRPDAAMRAASLANGMGRTRAAYAPDASSIHDEIDKSLASIGRVKENYSALQDNVRYFKASSEKNEQELQIEKDKNARLEQDLEEAQAKVQQLQASLLDEQNRCSEASSFIAALGKVIGGLENENASMRAQALRLVQGVEILMAAENDINLNSATHLLRSA